GRQAEGRVEAREGQAAQRGARQAVARDLAAEVVVVRAAHADLGGLGVKRGHQDGVPQIVLRLQQEGRLEVGGQLRDVQQRAEPLVQESPAWRAAVVVARVVGG